MSVNAQVIVEVYAGAVVVRHAGRIIGRVDLRPPSAGPAESGCRAPTTPSSGPASPQRVEPRGGTPRSPGHPAWGARGRF